MTKKNSYSSNPAIRDCALPRYLPTASMAPFVLWAEWRPKTGGEVIARMSFYATTYAE
jgi:hypothetical protein